MQVRVAVLVGVCGTLLALLGPASGAGAPGSAGAVSVRSTPGAATAVSVILKEGTIRASVVSVTAGNVTFVVQNAGKAQHDFVVIRSDRHHHLLPVSGRRASSSGAKGTVKSVAPGSTRRLTLNLAAGKYVLICNQPGHYKRQEYLAFTVKPATATTPGGAQTTDVNVSLFEMGFKLSKTTVPHGTVVFHLRNDGKLPHDFSFGSRGGGSPMLDPGATATFTVTFATAGKYTFICTVEGHYAAGMSGVLTVS